jgi:hypothetical protein
VVIKDGARRRPLPGWRKAEEEERFFDVTLSVKPVRDPTREMMDWQENLGRTQRYAEEQIGGGGRVIL